MKKRMFHLFAMGLALLLVAQGTPALVASAAGSEGATACVVSGALHLCEDNFPDGAFRAALADFDTNGDGCLSEEELADITDLNLQWQEIASLDGVGYLTALETLYVSNNAIQNLTITGLPALQTLYCDHNKLKTLTLRGCPALTELGCDENTLKDLDLSACPALRKLSCSNCILEALNVTKNPALTVLTCDGNRLTGLDLSGCPALKQLHCGNNQLEALSVKSCVGLTQLACANNRISSLKLQGLTVLNRLDCSENDLPALDLSGNPALTQTVLSPQSVVLAPQSAADGVNFISIENLVGAENCAKVHLLPGVKGTLNGGVLTLPASVSSVRYTYDVPKGSSTEPMQVGIYLADSDGLVIEPDADKNCVVVQGYWARQNTKTLELVQNSRMGGLTWSVVPGSAAEYGFSQDCVSVDDTGVLTALRSGICRVQVEDGTSQAEMTVVVPGDYNRDNRIATSDATAAIDLALMDEDLDARPYSMELLDVNGDGVINTSDASILVDLAIDDLSIAAPAAA